MLSAAPCTLSNCNWKIDGCDGGGTFVPEQSSVGDVIGTAVLVSGERFHRE